MSLTVKPLVWEHPAGHLWSFKHRGFAIAYIQRHLDDRYALDWYPQGPRHHAPGDYHPTLAAAQAAARIEWDAFIRAAVEETP